MKCGDLPHGGATAPVAPDHTNGKARPGSRHQSVSERGIGIRKGKPTRQPISGGPEISVLNNLHNAMYMWDECETIDLSLDSLVGGEDQFD